MAAGGGQMVLRCGKTGRLFFSAEEATEHAEAFGAAYANFEEVSMDTKVWVCVETKRIAYTEAELTRVKTRDPESKTWEEKTVAYLMQIQQEKEKASARKNEFLDSVDQKKFLALTEVKGHGRHRAAKALHFTRERGTIEAAEKWLADNADQPGLDALTDEFLDSVLGQKASSDVVMGDGDVEMTDSWEKRKWSDGVFYTKVDFRMRYLESKEKRKWTTGEFLLKAEAKEKAGEGVADETFNAEWDSCEVLEEKRKWTDDQFYNKAAFRAKFAEANGEVDDGVLDASWDSCEVAEGTAGTGFDQADFESVWGNAEDDKPKAGDPNPPEIKEKVNREMVEAVMGMGYSELRAEKALYKVDNAGVEPAVNWLLEHADDADIDMPCAKPGQMPPPKPKLSKEEAAIKAAELQKKLRAKKAAEEKLSEKEKERMRVESTKMMLEANEKLKEEERKRAIEQMKLEKSEHEKHKAKLKEQLRLDYIERFGCEPPPEEEEKEKGIKEKSSKEQMLFWLNKLKKDYKDTDREGLKTCISTLKVYIKNLADNPQDPKFKKLKVENKAFQSRIAPYPEAIELLDVMGFENKGEFLEQRKSVPDGWLCGNAIKFIDLMISQLS
eukprot:TRINITY_DN17551_c0_g1_i1.p1 TRINITY_DN17551_c0_g1~~TRINITY_DN17551_c0_g1_i1.p1  ORF type:complete len:612 (-),score=169.77 TRINITY_DN17551_c0_g1_i1:75-1910(-)